MHDATPSRQLEYVRTSRSRDTHRWCSSRCCCCLQGGFPLNKLLVLFFVFLLLGLLDMLFFSLFLFPFVSFCPDIKAQNYHVEFYATAAEDIGEDIIIERVKKSTGGES